MNINTKDDLEEVRQALNKYGISYSAFDVERATKDMLQQIIVDENTFNMQIDESKLYDRFDGSFVNFRLAMKEHFKQFDKKDKIVELVKAIPFESKFYDKSEYNKYPKYVKELVDARPDIKNNDINVSIVQFYDLQVIMKAQDFYKVRSLLNLLGVKIQFPNYYHETERMEFADESGDNIVILQKGRIIVRGAIVPMLNVIFRRKYESRKGTIIYTKFLKDI